MDDKKNQEKKSKSRSSQKANRLKNRVKNSFSDKTKIIFTDKNGREWNNIALQELIDGYEQFHEFLGFVEFYF